MSYHDKFQPRPFQAEVIKSVLDGFSSDRNVTVVLASPGSGKTLTYQAVATYLMREGLIDYVAAFVPRLTLARQCELSWMRRLPQQRADDPPTFGGDHHLFDRRARLGSLRHIPNRLPLLPPGRRGIGFVTTYSALVKSPDIYIDTWARAHRGRFLLVADEAQFCGSSGDEDGTGGTAAGRWVKELHQYAAHTLLLTGTPYRSDGQPLILAEYESGGEDGQRKLVSHAEASYATGIAEDYLRRFDAEMRDARVRYKYTDNSVFEYDLSLNGADLRETLRKARVWQPIADEVVQAVREKQQVNRRYRGLISCMQQPEARKVHGYLTSKYPHLKVALSVSDDGEDAERALQDFKTSDADILVTVRKAFIGYDCPEITVVGILTHYRDWGHLMQLVGRGLRVWKELPARDQSCRVICPDDPQMNEFMEFMRGESEQGLRERAKRDADRSEEDGPSNKQMQGQIGWVDDAYATHARAVGNDTEVDADELMLIKAIKGDLGLVEDPTSLKRFADALGLRLADLAKPRQGSDGQQAEEPTAGGFADPGPRTEQDQIKDKNRDTSRAIRSYVARRGVDPKTDPSAFQAQVRRVTVAVNNMAGCRADEAWTLEQAQARLDAITKIAVQEQEVV